MKAVKLFAISFGLIPFMLLAHVWVFVVDVVKTKKEK